MRRPARFRRDRLFSVHTPEIKAWHTQLTTRPDFLFPAHAVEYLDLKTSSCMSSDQQFPIFKHLSEAQVETVKQMDRLYSKNSKGPQKATDRTLHFYGQFTGELPEKFQPAGPYGHQYMKCKSIDEAEALCQELRSFIFSQWPDAMEWASDGWYRWMIHDLRQMTLQFEKAR